MRELCRRTTPDDFGRNRWADISIHVLRVEDDRDFPTGQPVHVPFQSTSSVWRTTWRAQYNLAETEISIHVLRVEDDRVMWLKLSGSRLFQSTSSVWRTTQVFNRIAKPFRISIHVLRVEDDAKFHKYNHNAK